jgi:ADP-dependent NAD(P)H-hydrate dehydratase
VSQIADLRALLAAAPLPAITGGKKNRGTLVAITSAATCPGGGLLAGLAALRVGAGRVRLVVDPAVATALGVAMPEAFVTGWDTSQPLPDIVAEMVEDADAVLVGPGLGPNAPDVAHAVAAAVPSGTPLMLDALAVAVATELAALSRSIVIAPNIEEAARMLQVDDIADEQSAIADAARALADRTGGPVAVRGAATVVVDGQGGCWCERGGVAGLGTAGSGDVFAGAAGGLLARQVEPLGALGWAVAVHAAAGRDMAERLAPAGFLAREIADALPGALARLERVSDAPPR